METNKNAILQSNLITTSSYNHTGLEENILSYIAFSMGADVQDEFVVDIHIKQLEELTGKTLSYGYVKDITKKLTSINYSIKWKDIKGTEYESLFNFSKSSKNSVYNDDDFVTVNCITKAKYITKEGMVSLVVNKDMIPFFTQLKKQFTKYNFTNFMQLSSFYSKRFYTMFSMFRSTGIFIKSLEDLKTLFDLKENYPRYKDFKRRVLVPSLNEINEVTEFEVTLEEKKKGRSVETLVFHFIEKKGKKVDSSEKVLEVPVTSATGQTQEYPLNDKAQRLQLRLKEIGLESKTITFALEKYQAQPDWKIWPEINACKVAIQDKKDFPNKFTLKKFIEGK